MIRVMKYLKRSPIKARFLTVADASAYTRISESHLRTLIEQHRIPVIRVDGGRAIRLLIDDLDSFLLANRIEARRTIEAGTTAA
jgi:excisionase family DNA binding protein